MSKIVQAVNAMVANPDLITKVVRGDSEYFFLYKDKYKWSMTKRPKGLYLWYYPGEESLEELAARDPGGFDDVDMVSYSDVEIGTTEAKASFAELFTLLNEKIYGVNLVLEDIISDNSF